MAKIAHVSRHLDSLIAGIIGAAPFLDSGLRRNDDETIDTDRQSYSLNPCLPPVIYGQEVLYAARGQGCP